MNNTKKVDMDIVFKYAQKLARGIDLHHHYTIGQIKIDLMSLYNLDNDTALKIATKAMVG